MAHRVTFQTTNRQKSTENVFVIKKTLQIPLILSKNYTIGSASKRPSKI